MDGKYCIKRTKMNKKGHFAYNLGIWLGLLSGTPLVRLQSGRPAVSHFFRGVTDFFMPKHCIWKLLIDKDLGKYEMIKMAGLSPYTLNKLNHNENVNAETLAKMLMYGKEASNRKQ